MHILLFLIFLPRPLIAAEKAQPEQNRCFCVQRTGGWPVPFEVLRVDAAPPGCEKIEYQAKSNTPEGNGILSCDALKKCLKTEYGYAEKRAALIKKMEEVKASCQSCDDRDPSPQCCAARMKKVRLEIAELDAKKSCFAKKAKSGRKGR